MQLKNNLIGNVQLHFSKGTGKSYEVEYVHIPGGATVELEDEIFEQLCKPLTKVAVMERVVEPIESEVPVQMDKKPVLLTEYYDTGETRLVNLFREQIKRGDFTVVERVKVGMDTIDKFLAGQGVSIADMPEERKLELYNKLA